MYMDQPPPQPTWWRSIWERLTLEFNELADKTTATCAVEGQNKKKLNVSSNN